MLILCFLTKRPNLNSLITVLKRGCRVTGGPDAEGGRWVAIQPKCLECASMLWRKTSRRKLGMKLPRSNLLLLRCKHLLFLWKELEMMRKRVPVLPALALEVLVLSWGQEDLGVLRRGVGPEGRPKANVSGLASLWLSASKVRWGVVLTHPAKVP